MIGYAATVMFTPRELKLYDLATTLVAIAPYELDGELIRCHELARAVGRVLGLRHEDGRFGFVEHTWLWTEPKDKTVAPWVLPRILDVYVPGSMPPVQLVDTASGLPPRYYLSNVFDVVVQERVINRLIRIFRDSPVCPPGLTFPPHEGL